MFLWTPILAEPPLCSLDDLRTRYSLMDLCGFHEALELKSENAPRGDAGSGEAC
jgi:hypothetical protein